MPQGVCMPAKKRTPIQIEDDRRETASLYLQGKTQQAIAERLGMTRQMVGYDLKAIQRRWRQDTARDLDEDKAKELAKLDELERTHWQAWESRSLMMLMRGPTVDDPRRNRWHIACFGNAGHYEGASGICVHVEEMASQMKLWHRQRCWYQPFGDTQHPSRRVPA